MQEVGALDDGSHGFEEVVGSRNSRRSALREVLCGLGIGGAGGGSNWIAAGVGAAAVARWLSLISRRSALMSMN